MWTRHAARAAAVVGIVGVAAGLAACGGYVKQDEYTAEVAKIREEMQAGDRQVAGRVDANDRMLADHERRIAALEQEFQALRNEYQVGIEKVKGLLKFNVPVHFEFDQSELRQEDLPVLDRFATVVKEYYPGALVTAEGFADPAGNHAYNVHLGQRRAEAVRDYLVGTAGLPAEGLRAVSYGEAGNRQVIPGARGPGDTGIENRRVTLVVDHAAVAMDQVAAQ